MGTNTTVHTGIYSFITQAINNDDNSFLCSAFFPHFDFLHISYSLQLIHTTPNRCRFVFALFFSFLFIFVVTKPQNIRCQNEKECKRHFCINTTYIHCYRKNWGKKACTRWKKQAKERKTAKKIEKCTEIVFDVLKSANRKTHTHTHTQHHE